MWFVASFTSVSRIRTQSDRSAFYYKSNALTIRLPVASKKSQSCSEYYSFAVNINLYTTFNKTVRIFVQLTLVTLLINEWANSHCCGFSGVIQIVEGVHLSVTLNVACIENMQTGIEGGVKMTKKMWTSLLNDTFSNNSFPDFFAPPSLNQSRRLWVEALHQSWPQKSKNAIKKSVRLSVR